jgi:hypothetical protein
MFEVLSSRPVHFRRERFPSTILLDQAGDDRITVKIRLQP